MALLDALQVYSPAELQTAAMNMAIDEALLASAAVPSLRFYRWRQPSISFGYFGRCADVAAHQSTREIVRRWTGGGIVFHGDDLTYSLVLPADVSAKFRSSRIIYSEVHGAIRRALTTMLRVNLASLAAPKVSEACFANPVEADVMLDGRKIAGAAQRRTRAGLLHQGSIQYCALPTDFPVRFAAALCPRFETASFTRELLSEAELLAARRYGTDEWLRRR